MLLTLSGDLSFLLSEPVNATWLQLEGIILPDQGDYLVYCNIAANSYLGASTQPVIGKKILLNPDLVGFTFFANLRYGV